ncbi:hypothetical protein GQ53DRAFT_743130 [Thozetella sp. PMI_491]|nr:hypothetical protein GQ53DRAFT_743130 [Thozetella sp. PMI_491]
MGYDDAPAALLPFLNGPSSPPPEGVQSNLDNPSNNTPACLAFGVVCTVLTTAAVLVRLYSRLVVVKRLRIEDYIGFSAFLPFIGYLWTYFDFGVKLGFFVHQWDLPGHVLIDLGLIGFIVGISYCMVMLLLKTAILVEWIRIFVPGRKRDAFFWAATALIVLNTMLYISAIVSDIFACKPIPKMWDIWLDGTCIDRKLRDIINAAFNLIVDAFIVILPQKIIWSVMLSGRRRLLVSFVFSVGLLVVVLAAGRLYATITLDYPNDITKPYDTSYKFSETSMWALAEITCIFLVFAVPSLPKLITENGIMSRLLMFWRSWTSVGSPSASTEEPKVQAPQTIGSAPNRRYPNPLDDLTQQTRGDQHQDQADSLDPSIAKSIEADHRDDVESKTSADLEAQRQHPWMDR